MTPPTRTAIYNSEYFVPLRPEKDWPRVVKESGWRSVDFRRHASPNEGRAGDGASTMSSIENCPASRGISRRTFATTSWRPFPESKATIRSRSWGPDLDKLEVLAARTKTILQKVRGIENVGIFNIRGQSHMEWRVDPDKCERWGVQTSDVNNVVPSALGGVASSNMIEGEKRFDIAVRWPKRSPKQRDGDPRYPRRHHQ